MQICSDSHEQIVYGSRTCPLCDVLADLKDTSDRVTELEQELESKVDS